MMTLVFGRVAYLAWSSNLVSASCWSLHTSRVTHTILSPSLYPPTMYPPSFLLAANFSLPILQISHIRKLHMLILFCEFPMYLLRFTLLHLFCDTGFSCEVLHGKLPKGSCSSRLHFLYSGHPVNYVYDPQRLWYERGNNFNLFFQKVQNHTLCCLREGYSVQWPHKTIIYLCTVLQEHFQNQLNARREYRKTMQQGRQ